ncbi:hypothetical protein ACQV2S_00905 [Facklamia sp. P13064]|uniref:hypothetical protein n=1 Tax=Facklamia sp. P13064 TaxID=3421953 RepID=UPI003D174E65
MRKFCCSGMIFLILSGSFSPLIVVNAIETIPVEQAEASSAPNEVSLSGINSLSSEVAFPKVSSSNITTFRTRDVSKKEICMNMRGTAIYKK